MLQRTQIMLDPQLRNDLNLIALRKGISMSQVVRELLTPVAKEESQTTQMQYNKYAAREFFERMGKHTVSGPGDGEYDKYAYDL